MLSCELVEEEKNGTEIFCSNQSAALAVNKEDPTFRLAVCFDHAEKLEKEGDWDLTYMEASDDSE